MSETMPMETTHNEGGAERGRVAVRVGQVWADNDPRSEGRTLLVVEMLPNGAMCEVLTDRRGARVSTVGRGVAIRLDRFRPTRTGYRLVCDSPDKA